MSPKTLSKITMSLKAVLRELARLGLKDRNIRCQYAEYLVAKKLTDAKHDVQILNQRDDKSADIFLTKTGERVEVKSSCFDDDRWAFASFTDGNQIKRDKFDYCVWLIFDEKNSESPKKTFIFERKELQEVTKARRRFASHKTNSCLLTYGRKLKSYDDWMKKHSFERLKIERELLKNPSKFTGTKAWDKIRRMAT
jgi:hypothetical protein